ncbi:transcriptional regulator [Corynebacterium sp. zg-331]|uniref:transcriptional regulator n=1 Tax=unclassified Corynebacterium TaxID=2624378 RepID=UPI00128D6F8D|nr:MULTISPECIES: transcriptional regulator [unclassified Corynebacterium]MBC3186395.1 transcriptional regulator [Corynebacterium sp. zg-331]MPV52881.1 transcriptional regulator [Corynebacterium sp. zg331]
MEYRLDPTVLDHAKAASGARSDEQLGQMFLYKTGETVRKWRRGATNPDVVSLMRLKNITGRPLDTMMIHESATAAA